MSKELVLLPKRKYEDLIQQKGEGESAPALENERLINISPPSMRQMVVKTWIPASRRNARIRKWTNPQPTLQ